MKTTRTLFAAALALPLLLAGCGAGGGGEEPILLGLAGPMDQPYGRAQRLAAQLAVERINADGGIHGRPLELVIKDDREDPERAIEVATELRANKSIVAVVGHINSSTTLAAAEVYNHPERGVVELSPTASSPRLSEAGPWTFRVCPSDLQHGPALAEWAYGRLGSRRAVVLYANDAYGRGLMQGFAAAFEEAGGTVLSKNPYLPALIDSDSALDPYLERAIRNGMDALMIAGMVEQGKMIVRAARRLGYQGPVLGADGLIGIESLGQIAHDVYVSAPFLPDRSTRKAQEFVRTYRQRYGEAPDAFAALSYDAVMLIARALREVLEGGGPRNPQALRRAIRDYLAGVGTETEPFEGVTGTIAFDENGDVPNKELVIGTVRDGRLVTAGTQ